MLQLTLTRNRSDRPRYARTVRYARAGDTLVLTGHLDKHPPKALGYDVLSKPCYSPAEHDELLAQWQEHVVARPVRLTVETAAGPLTFRDEPIGPGPRAALIRAGLLRPEGAKRWARSLKVVTK
jgi:hypothetical protein